MTEFRRRTRFVLASILAVGLPAMLAAQARVIRVISNDGQPIPFANVIVEGGTTQISDLNGEVNLGSGKRQTLTLNVRRIGFSPWFGRMELPDTASVLQVTLPRLAQELTTVTVSGEGRIKSPLEIKGFYDRWLMRQKGMLSAVFISPEELEFRHPDKITGMLSGLNGVQLKRKCVEPADSRGHCLEGLVALSMHIYGCPMTIVVDGQQQYPTKGGFVDLDMLLMANDVAAIELYARGGNMPVNFQFQDTGCGVLAFWTGSRRP